VEVGAGANGGVVFFDGMADDASENFECIFAFGYGVDFLLSGEGKRGRESGDEEESGVHGV
jgi:hypothetical protein